MQVPSRSEKEPTLQGVYERRTLVSNGLEREYFVFTPTRAEAGGKLPLLVGLHGYVGTATGFEEETSGGMNRHAEQEGYIAVYPQGLHFLDRRTDPPSFVSSWNDLETNRAAKEGERPICRDSEHGYACPSECGDCGACGWTSCADDIAFIAAVIESVSDEYPVDGSRRYVVGLSNGGAMAHRFACLRPDLLAAGVSVSGAIPRDRSCQPHAPISYMQIYGDADSQTPADGSVTWDGFYYERPEVALTQWADAMGCAALEVAPELSVAQKNGLICTARRECQGPPGTEVVNCLVLGGGHAWPGESADRGYCRGDLQNSSIPDYAACQGQAAGTGGWGIPAIWEFLSRHQSASP